MDSRKSGFDVFKAERRERNDVRKGREVAQGASKEQPIILSENSARIVTGKIDSQVVESKAVNCESIDEQIFRIIGEISDDECDSSPILNRKRPVAAKHRALCRKRRFSELFGETSDDEGDLSSKFVKVSRKTAVRAGRAKASVLRKNRKQKFLELFGEASDDDDVSSTYVKGSSKPSDSAIFRANKKESGFPREWRLTEIDVDVQHRRHEKMTGPSGELYKSFFSVDSFQLEEFDAIWESFVSREVSCGISDYRPSMATVGNWI